eukprot:2832740-Rhodomonas_salina.3
MKDTQRFPRYSDPPNPLTRSWPLPARYPLPPRPPPVQFWLARDLWPGSTVHCVSTGHRIAGA